MTVGELKKILSQFSDDEQVISFYSQYDGSSDVDEFCDAIVYATSEGTCVIVADKAEFFVEYQNDLAKRAPANIKKWYPEFARIA